MDERLSNIEKDLVTIKERNARVEADKAWEVSAFRKALITVITYVLALVLYFIGIPNFYLSALIPTIGYVLSTLSIPMVKRWWVGRNDLMK